MTKFDFSKSTYLLSLKLTFLALQTQQTMARQEGMMHFVGRMGDLVYYKRGNQYLVRRVGQPSKEALKSGANFEKTRNWNKEFGGAAVMCKAFRELFAPVVGRFSDSYFSGRLTGVFRKLIGLGGGKEGERMAMMRAHGPLLVGFQFRKEEVFDSIFKATMTWELEAERRSLALSVPAFDPKARIAKVKATHCQLIVAAGAFSDYVYHQEKAGYAPIDGNLNKNLATATSDYLSLAVPCEGFRMMVNLDASSSKAAAVAVIGLVFYKEEGGKMHELESRRCMKVGFVEQGFNVDEVLNLLDVEKNSSVLCGLRNRFVYSTFIIFCLTFVPLASSSSM